MGNKLKYWWGTDEPKTSGYVTNHTDPKEIENILANSRTITNNNNIVNLKEDKKMGCRSYGRFKEFEIRDFTRLGDFISKKGTFKTERVDAIKEGRFDLVKWEQMDNGKKYCFSIGELVWNEDEGAFEFNSCGLRYLEHSTPELNEWILRWCSMMSLTMTQDGEEYV